MELDKLRTQIDLIDEEIIIQLARRFELTAAIGVIKHDLAMESISPERESKQFTKLKLLADRNKLPYQLVEKIFRNIINEVVQNHESIKKRRN